MIEVISKFLCATVGCVIGSLMLWLLIMCIAECYKACEIVEERLESREHVLEKTRAWIKQSFIVVMSFLSGVFYSLYGSSRCLAFVIVVLYMYFLFTEGYKGYKTLGRHRVSHISDKLWKM